MVGRGEDGVGNMVRVLRGPVSRRTWRAFGYLMLGLPLSTVFFTLTITGVSLGAGLLVTFLGVPLLAGVLAMCRGFGHVERARARALLGLEIADPAPVRPSKPGGMGLIGATLKNGSAWRHVLYCVIHFPWSVFAFVVSLSLWAYGWAFLLYPAWFWVFPAFTDQPGLQVFQNGDYALHLDSPADIVLTTLTGLALTLVTPAVIHGLTAVDKALVTGLLGPSRLASRVTELESDRGVVVDTAAADLRRIERDLHDGAQARLVALAMDLGLAKEKLADDPQAAARMVDEAHGEVKVALQELRDLARGIHPAVLTDRGLDAALSSVASRCAVPVRVRVDLPARPAAAIEGIAYFTVSELLQNVSKHARARSASVDVWKSGDRMLIEVADDGLGGAGHSHGSGTGTGHGSGTGLAGLTERIGAVDGVLVVESPTGGGTTVTAELPWREQAGADGSRRA
ncbi:sensor histidine kinase [Streptomyces sp. NPDC090022]|uniref:sensor histidine kinase n=1 Tax=Streptomyces sp. NPDC090022 TaxID=3365920 RepID=UPI00380CBA8C